jgi:hypothetical protein
MINNIRTVLASMAAVLAFCMTPALSAEPTADMRTFARMFATLEAGDQNGYCTAMHGAPYMDYLNQVCQSAVQNRLKKPEDCTPDYMTRQVKADTDKCLEMPATEFEMKKHSGRDASKMFVEQMKAQGVDGEKLLQEARTQKH